MFLSKNINLCSNTLGQNAFIYIVKIKLFSNKMFFRIITNLPII